MNRITQVLVVGTLVGLASPATAQSETVQLDVLVERARGFGTGFSTLLGEGAGVEGPAAERASSGISDLNVCVEGSEICGTTDAYGRASLPDVPVGELTVVVESSRFETERLTFEARPGTMAGSGMVHRGSCPPGAACMMAADAFIEVAAAAADVSRSGPTVVRVIRRDEADVTIWFSPTAEEAGVTLSEEGLTIQVVPVRDRFSTVWEVSVMRGADVIVSGELYGLDAVPAGCETLCPATNGSEVVRAEFARSTIGNPLSLCSVDACASP